MAYRKFHLSPKLGRMAPCTGVCQYGNDTPHFETEAEGNEWIAEKAAKDNSVVPKPVRKGDLTEVPDTYAASFTTTVTSDGVSETRNESGMKAGVEPRKAPPHQPSRTQEHTMMDVYNRADFAQALVNAKNDLEAAKNDLMLALASDSENSHMYDAKMLEVTTEAYRFEITTQLNTLIQESMDNEEPEKKFWSKVQQVLVNELLRQSDEDHKSGRGNDFAGARRDVLTDIMYNLKFNWKN